MLCSHLTFSSLRSQRKQVFLQKGNLNLPTREWTWILQTFRSSLLLIQLPPYFQTLVLSLILSQRVTFINSSVTSSRNSLAENPAKKAIEALWTSQAQCFLSTMRRKNISKIWWRVVTFLRLLSTTLRVKRKREAMFNYSMRNQWFQVSSQYYKKRWNL
jgi:hypothetical protein